MNLNKVRKFLMFCFTFIFLINLSVQVKCVTLKTFNQEHGIKNTNSESFVFQDSKGYIWISTNNGLSLEKWNGYKCKSYAISILDSKASYIQGNFFEDSQTNIWFSTYNAIIFYNRLKDEFSSFQVLDTNKVKIVKGYHLIYLDSLEQKIWFSAGNKIFSRDVNSSNAKCLPFDTKKAIKFVFQKGENGSRDRIISCYWMKPGVEVYTKNNNEGWTQEQFDLKELGSPKIKRGVKQSNTVAWFVSEMGLIEYNQDDVEQFKLYKSDEEPKGYRNVIKLNDHQLLLSGAKSGLHVFDINRKKITQTYNQENTGLTTNVYDSMWKDGNSGIWLPHDNGIDYLQINKCTGFKFESEKVNENSFVGIRSILEVNKGLVFLNAEKAVVKIESIDGNFVFTDELDAIKELLPSTEIFGICKKENDTFLLLTKNAVYSYCQNTIELIDSLENGLYNFMYQLKDGRCLVSSMEGVKEISKRGNTFKVTKNKYFTNSLSTYQKIFENNAGDVFVVTNASELQIYIKEKDQLKTIGLGADIMSFYESKKDDKIWLGTTKGLGFVDKDFVYHSVLNNDWEIGRNIVLSVLEDDEENLWVATNTGLWRYNEQSKELRVFRKEDGIVTSNFLKDSKAKLSDGRLAFGTSQGLLYFDPKEIKISNNKPKIQIENFIVNDKPFDYEFVKGDSEENVSLDFSQNSIGLKPVVLCYNLPKYNKVRYRIENYQDNWRIVPSGEKIYFTALSAGRKYQLELVGINANNIESDKMVLEFDIALPFWRRWWFQLLVLGFVSLLIWGIMSLYYRQKLIEKQIELDRQEALSNQRKALADDLHDNLGNDLSEILHISDAALISNISKKDEALDSIAELTIDSMMNMRFMITVLEGEDESLKGLLYSIREYTNKILQRHKIEFKVDFPETIPDVKVNGTFKLNFSYLVKECLGNLVKHSQATKAKIKVGFEDKSIYFSVDDNGKGFDVDSKLGKGKGLNTMEKRVAVLDGHINIESKCREGTCVEFWVPL